MRAYLIRRIICSAVIALVCGLMIRSQLPFAEAAQAEGGAKLQDAYIEELQKKIAGQESRPAEEVFKNIQLFKGMPAARVLRIMAVAFNPALGIDCTHCHVAGQWEKDDKEAKQTARKMWQLQTKLNEDLKTSIGKGAVNCYTCHRGEVKPALNPAKS